MKIEFCNPAILHDRIYAKNIEAIRTDKNFIVIFNKKRKHIFPVKKGGIMRALSGTNILWIDINLRWGNNTYSSSDYICVGKNK